MGFLCHSPTSDVNVSVTRGIVLAITLDGRNTLDGNTRVTPRQVRQGPRRTIAARPTGLGRPSQRHCRRLGSRPQRRLGKQGRRHVFRWSPAIGSPGNPITNGQLGTHRWAIRAGKPRGRHHRGCAADMGRHRDIRRRSPRTCPRPRSRTSTRQCLSRRSPNRPGRRSPRKGTGAARPCCPRRTSTHMGPAAWTWTSGPTSRRFCRCPAPGPRRPPSARSWRSRGEPGTDGPQFASPRPRTRTPTALAATRPPQ